MKFTKPAISIGNQITLLKNRGLQIDDEAKAAHYLSNISYYRLRAYMMPLQIDNDPNHAFIKGATFENILDYYRFDRQLRTLLFDATERIEVAFRTQMIYHLSLIQGAWWYEDPSLYRNNYNYSKILAKIDEELGRSNEVFITHYKTKYTNPQRPPAWMTIEVCSMGALSKIYHDLKMSSEKKAIANHFGLAHPILLESWMQSLTYVRNVCAHHGRIFNRVLTLKPTYPNNPKGLWLSDMSFHHAKIYGFSSCLLYMLKQVIPSTSFAVKFKDLVNQYPIIQNHQLGCSTNWQNEKLWQ